MDPRNQPSLLERIYSWENLLDAYHEAASEKWYRNDVTAFAANLEENLISIQNDLIWHTYKVGRYRQFYVQMCIRDRGRRAHRGGVQRNGVGAGH